MKVKVQYFAALHEITSVTEEILDVKGDCNISDLLTILIERHGRRLQEFLFDPETGKPREYLQFLLNEEPVSNLSGLLTPLVEGSVLAIIPPVGGG